MASDIRFAEVKRLLESHGWVLSRIKGSHHVFTKAGESPTVIPVHHRKVNHVYVREIKKQLGIGEED
jgi:predicted RNA binding protein YcfA (HicA-like mRNA interferase family)